MDRTGRPEPHDDSEESIMIFLNNLFKYLPDSKQYQVPLLFKEWPPLGLPDNAALAKSRHISLKRQIDKKISVRKNLAELCKKERDAKFIEKVPVEELHPEIPAHYLSSLLVEREGHPSTPLRRVCDYSAHLKNKPSLNDFIA